MTLLSSPAYIGRCGMNHLTPLPVTTRECRRIASALSMAESRKRDGSLVRNCEAFKSGDWVHDTRSKTLGGLGCATSIGVSEPNAFRGDK